MRNRLFLLSLITVLLLIQAVQYSAISSTPFSEGETLGGHSFWELRGAIPLGIFAVGLLMVSTAAAAITTRAALQWTHSAPHTGSRLSSITAACLWCGIPAIASNLNVLPYIFPWLLAHSTESWQNLQHLEWVLHGSMILLVISHVAEQTAPKSAPILLFIPILILLVLGQIGFGMAFILTPIAIMAAAGLLMLSGRGRRWSGIPLFTAILMNGILLWLTANPVATIPAAAIVYTCTLLLLSIPFYLKATQNRH